MNQKLRWLKHQAQLGQAQANLAKAKSERNRYQFLACEGAISVQNLESRSTDATAFEEEVRSAKAEINRVEAEFDSVQAEVDSYRAEVSSAQANLGNAQADLKSAQANVTSSKAQIQQLRTSAIAYFTTRSCKWVGNGENSSSWRRDIF